MRGRIVAIMDGTIRQTQKVVESEWPKNNRQRQSFQQRAHGVPNSLVWAFGESVLVRGVGAGELHIVAVLRKEIVHGTAFAEFSALIESDILLLAVGAERGQPTVPGGALDLNALPESMPLKWSEMMT